SGPVRAPESGMILLPLYQGQGEDGFFTCRRVPRLWFALSPVLRRLGLDRLLRLLPGIRRDAGDPNTLLADPRIARFLVVDVFHLLGYRRARRRGERLAFTRRFATAECHAI